MWAGVCDDAQRYCVCASMMFDRRLCERVSANVSTISGVNHQLPASYLDGCRSRPWSLLHTASSKPRRIILDIMTAVELSAADLKSILDFTTELARTAGDLILQGSQAIRSSGNVDEKKNSVDLVTEYDVKVEELVKKELGTKYPNFKLYVSLSVQWAQDRLRYRVFIMIIILHIAHSLVPSSS